MAVLDGGIVSREPPKPNSLLAHARMLSPLCEEMLRWVEILESGFLLVWCCFSKVVVCFLYTGA
ncbi:MAG TPA: hypothetical protein DCE42_09095 [Myxococcales bacterium]|nr:hypothetical protein [Deltaproteobacteria bacterium]MBU50951.1 hypothetical protein [Deltaproteobacteria bacterium]HAA54901.1 hypothetical protein [Myxococcales bacterium]